MTPSEIKSALSRLGGGANKRLGQHFLIDQAALEAVVESASIKPGDRVLEVGPGLGVLTRELLDRGADVVAIEQDRRFVEYLRGKEGVRVIHGDAASVHWHELIGEGTWKFVSNLPYGITSLALRKALWAPKPPEVVSVLVQREVAERAVALTPSSSPFARGRAKGSLLSLMVALASSSARIVRRVPPGAFYPPPKVESAVLQIVPMSWEERQKKWGIEPEKIMEVAKKGFAHPRKLLASNLKSAGMPEGGHGGPPLRAIGVNEKARAEELSPDDWARLAIHFS